MSSLLLWERFTVGVVHVNVDLFADLFWMFLTYSILPSFLLLIQQNIFLYDIKEMDYSLYKTALTTCSLSTYQDLFNYANFSQLV